MTTGAESEVVVGVPPDVEAERLLEDLLVVFSPG